MASVHLSFSDDKDRVRFERRLWTRIEKSSSCWVWQGALNSTGYGVIGVRKHGHYQQYRVHRVVYELLVAVVPDDLILCHTCDNPRCCNPDHLFLGTHRDNAVDRQSKGRGSKLRGSQNPSAKLSEDKVRDIRRLWAAGATNAQLAVAYGVSWGLIRKIVQRFLWRHVE